MNETDPRLTGGNPLPQNIEAEGAVLAAAILSGEVVPELVNMLEPEDFYRHANRIVFAAVKELWQRDIPVDQVSLTEYLQGSGGLAQVGGPAFILDLANNSFALVNWEQHARIVRRCAVLRRLISASTGITALAFDAPPDDVADIVRRSEEMLFKVTDRQVSNAAKPLGEFVQQAYGEIEEIALNKGHISGVITGFAELDKYILGMRPGSLNVVGARPGVGKTSFALSLALNAAKAGVSVVFFSLEMSGTEIATRLICAEAGVSNEDVRSGRIAPEMWTPILQASDRLNRLDFIIDDTAGTNVVEIRTKARRALHGKEHGLVIVDYLQLVTPVGRNKNDSMATAVGEISRSLKILAKDLQIPVIALSQLNRDIDRRPDKRPVLADLRESGAIEQDADLVMFLDRSLTDKEAEDTKHDRPPLGTANVIIAKNRSGRSGVTIPLAFLSDRTTFRSLARTSG